jgi:hypothetical protein
MSILIVIQSNYRRQVSLQTLYSLPKPYKYIPLIVMQSNCRRQVSLQTIYSLPKPYKYIPLDWDAE